MKKYALMFIMFLLLASPVFSATIDLTSDSFNLVDGRDNVWEIIFTSTDSVTTGTPQLFRLIMPDEIGSHGDIKEFYVQSLSPDLVVKVYASEALASELFPPIIDITVDLEYSPDLGNGRYWTNKDDPVQKSVYVLMTNDSLIDTDNLYWSFSIGRK